MRLSLVLGLAAAATISFFGILARMARIFVAPVVILARPAR